VFKHSKKSKTLDDVYVNFLQVKKWKKKPRLVTNTGCARPQETYKSMHRHILSLLQPLLSQCNMFELGELQSAEGWQRVGQDCNSPQEET
jgi:hypothetical protein